MNIALTIAGSDPTGGAGLQADLKVFHSLGVYGIAIPSVLTAQNTGGVYKIHDIPSDFFSAQLDILLKDISPDAVKTGMLYTADIVGVAVDKIKEFSLKNLVVDPVAVSSTGLPLIKEAALESMRNNLFPIARVITPNVYEASLFTGVDIQNREDMKKAAVRLRESGPRTVIITGGHLLFDGDDFLSLENDRLEGDYHGTGCVFSSAIAACLALGYDVREASVKAKELVWKAMKSAVSIGRGMKILKI